MNSAGDSGDRESIWGINPKDRHWFQGLTLLGGTVCSIVLSVLIFEYRTDSDTPDGILLSILLGIGASFVACGFIAWGILQAKEIIMSIGDWIRELNARQRERLIRRGREEGRAEGIDEGYLIGYDDGREGRPKQPPSGGSEPNEPEPNGPGQSS